MEPMKGYWRRYVLPKIDLETGRSEYRGSLPKAIASFGFPDAQTKPPPDVGETPNPKGKASGKGKRGNTLTAGTQEMPMIYASGKRLMKPEGDLDMAHAPREGKEMFRRVWDSHGGCSKAEKFERKHDILSGQNFHLDLEAEPSLRG